MQRHCYKNKGVKMELIKRIFDGEIRGIDEKERTLTAYVSTNARDRMNEVMLADGVDFSKFKKNPVVLFAHDYRQPPIGRALWIKRDGEGIMSKMQFANTEFAQEVFSLYKDGFMKAFSVGFIPKEVEDGDGEKTPRRTYKKWELLEYSAVPVPANPEALMLAVSKGLHISDDLKKMFEKKEEEEITPEPVIEATAPEIIEEPKKNINDELLVEIKLLKDENFNLKTTIFDLRHKLLQKDMKKEQTLSEMTDSEILKKIEDIAVGVIRKITGKVN